MAKNPETPVSESSPSEIRGKLIKRLAIAGVLVASLLGMLAFFDYLATAPEEPEAPVFTRPVPVAPKKEVSQPVTPATNLPEPPTPASPEPVVEAPPAPVVEAPPAPALEAQPPAVVTTKPGMRPDSRPEIRPSAPSTAATAKIPVVPPVPTSPASSASGRPPRAAPEATASPTMDMGQAAPVPAKPSVRILEAKSAPTMPTPQRLFAGFLVQAGVFTSAQRAEELHAKLTLSGIPSSLEARVQVGPFRTRQEAEIAQAKLRELGVESVLLPPKGAKP